MTQHTSNTGAAHHRSEAAPARNGSNLSERVRSLRLSENTQSGGQRGSTLPWVLCGILLVLSVAFGYRAYRVAPAAEISAADTDGDLSKKSSIGSATAASSGVVALEAKGYVTAVHRIQISPQVGGEIIKLDPNFREGTVYKKGAFLALIDPVIYEAQVKTAEAALKVADTNLRQVETGSTLNDIEVCKAQIKNLTAKLELSQIDERYNRAARFAVSSQDNDKATAQVRLDQTALTVQEQSLAKLLVSLEEQRLVAKAQVLSAQGNLEQAQKQLKNCTVIAPVTGFILTYKAELGGYVNPFAFGGVSGYLCEMADLADLEIEVMVQERDVAGVFQDQKCSIMPDAFQRDETFLKKHPNGFDGIVSRLMPTADRSKGAIAVRVKVLHIPPDEVGFYLKPDMGNNVSFKKKAEK